MAKSRVFEKSLYGLIFDFYGKSFLYAECVFSSNYFRCGLSQNFFSLLSFALISI